MTKQCEIVKDLLPLYADEVCSESSAELVKEHLKNCPDCLECYNQMCSKTDVETLEKEKAEVIKRHEKKEKKIIRRKILVLMLVIAIVFPIICHAVINIQYKHILQKPEIIDYNESKIFTQQEIDGAIKLIKKEWAQYDDLKIVVFTSSENAKFWEEIQNCPYFWDDNKTLRFFGTNIDDIKAIYKNYYTGKLVHFDDTADEGGFLSAAALSGKDDMQLCVFGNEDRIILVARYDNLGKGASGAAIQNMNILCLWLKLFR